MFINLVNVALGIGGFVIHGADAERSIRNFSFFRWGHQRRWLRRPHHRGDFC